MARKVVITMVDDLDGRSAAAETVWFAIDGVTYEIDLSQANADDLRASLDRWIPFARRVHGRRRPKASSTESPAETKVVRAWARQNGHAVPQRGRIPSKIVAAYQATRS